MVYSNGKGLFKIDLSVNCDTTQACLDVRSRLAGYLKRFVTQIE